MSHAIAPRQRPLTMALAAACLLAPGLSPHAGTVSPGQTVTVDGQQAPDERWDVAAGGTLNVMNQSTVGFIDVTQATLTMRDSVGTGGGTILPFGVRIQNGSTASLDNVRFNGTFSGVDISAYEGSPGSMEIARAQITRGSEIRGGSFAARVQGRSELDVEASSLIGTGKTSYGLGLYSGSAMLHGNTQVVGEAGGVEIASYTSPGVPNGGRELIVDGSTISGVHGSAIHVTTLHPSTPTTATIRLTGGANLLGGDGVAVRMDDGTSTLVDIRGSAIQGAVIAEDGASASLGLDEGATLAGRVTGDVAVRIGTASTWQAHDGSHVSALALDGGTLALGDGSPVPASLRLGGDLGGTGGALVLRATMNAGGPLGSQETDRLLVEGSVATSGPTEIVVVPRGSGATTDTDADGVLGPGEGLSLIQVGGTSRADAFHLRGGYVAAGAFQYRLKAFGPGEVDQAQNALAGGALQWDYRLGSERVCEDGNCDPVDPVDPPVDPPIDPPVDPVTPVTPVVPPVEPPVDPAPGEGSRVAVVPQLPSYLSAPAALLTYGDLLDDGLHQRLGELRNGTSSDPLGGEVFARYLGGQLRYTPNLSFDRYGYDFDQQMNALQIGGSLIALDGDNGSLRAGWAADHGTTRVTPKAVDGDSSAKYRANGVSGWVAWQQAGGWWLDAVVGATRYRGDIGTDLRGADVARIRAHGWTTSVEAGMPFALGAGWSVEPRVQLKHRQLSFRDFTDADGLDVTLGTAKQTSATLGARIMRSSNARFMPYAGVDLTHTSNGDPTANISSTAWNVSDRFGSGRLGNDYRVSAGTVSQLTDHVQVYGEGHYQHFVGSYGMRGWAGNLGVRVTF